jgi:hypothetical protein
VVPCAATQLALDPTLVVDTAAGGTPAESLAISGVSNGSSLPQAGVPFLAQLHCDVFDVQAACCLLQACKWQAFTCMLHLECRLVSDQPQHKVAVWAKWQHVSNCLDKLSLGGATAKWL